MTRLIDKSRLSNLGLYKKFQKSGDFSADWSNFRRSPEKSGDVATLTRTSPMSFEQFISFEIFEIIFNRL